MTKLPFNIKVNSIMFETTLNCQTISDILKIDVDTIHNVTYRTANSSDGMVYFVDSVIIK